MRIFDCNSQKYTSRLDAILKKRISFKSKETKIVRKIISDIKKNKIKSLLKYEKKFSKNNQITLSKKKN